MNTDAKKECEGLMNELLAIAEQMLGRYGEFYPYGGYMKPNGETVHVGVKEPGTDRPKSKDLISTLFNGFRDLAANNQCKATAVVYNVLVPLPDNHGKADAIQVNVDHIDNYSAEVFFPYKLIEHQLVYGDTFAQEGKYEIFGKDPGSEGRTGLDLNS
jgi:hypothetical protein